MTPPIAVSTTGLPPLAVTTPCEAWWSTAAVTVMKPKITVMIPSTANPANGHSNAVLASGIWQATDLHQLTGTVEY